MSLATRLRNGSAPLRTRLWNTCWTIMEWLLLFVLLVFVPLGLVSLPLSIEWQAQDLARHSETMTLDDGRTLTVDYPAIVLIDDKPAPFSFSLDSSSLPQPITQPLTVTVQLDRAFLLAVPPQTYRDDAPLLTFQPLASRVKTQTLLIANARLVGGLEHTGKVTLTVTGDSSPAIKTLSVQVEGTLRAALRDLVGNSLNWLITALLSAAGLVFTLFEKRREAEEKREAEKREQAKQERDRFRNWMQQNAHLAQEVFDDLEKQGLVQHLASSDLAWMRRLVDWSKGNLAGFDFKTLPSDWLDAAAGALVFARENGLGNDQEVSNALRQLPVDKLSSKTLQDAVQNPIKLPEQAGHWPLVPAKPDWNLITLRKPWQDRLGVNPFPYEYAEDDATILFPQVGAFWEEHSLYQRIKTTNKSEIIAGDAGTGKTAMALALGEYLHNAETLACYLSGLSEEHEIRRALAKKILDFVCWHPTFLRKLGQDSRGLLAHVCVDLLGDQIVLAKLDTAAAQEMEFVKQAQNEQDRKRRESIVRSQLRLFRETIVSLPAREHLSHCDWYGALAQCARSLGFQLPIRVIIDASGEKCAEWLNESVLPRIPFWKMDGVIVKIFIPSTASNAIKFPEDHLGWLVFSDLEWDSPLLTQMLEHRFKSIMAARQSRVVRPEVVDDHLWNRMIASAKNNPRCFIRLWNRMLAIAANGVLNESVLGQALEGWECP